MALLDVLQQLLRENDLFLRLMATASTNGRFPQPQRSGEGLPAPQRSSLQTVPAIWWWQLLKVYSIC